MGKRWMDRLRVTLVLAVPLFASACASDAETPGNEANAGKAVSVSKQALEQRAYIVSKLSDELTIIDLKKLEIIGQVKTLGEGNHMAELNADFTKAFVDSSETNESVVVDLRSVPPLLFTKPLLFLKSPNCHEPRSPSQLSKASMPGRNPLSPLSMNESKASERSMKLRNRLLVMCSKLSGGFWLPMRRWPMTGTLVKPIHRSVGTGVFAMTGGSPGATG